MTHILNTRFGPGKKKVYYITRCGLKYLVCVANHFIRTTRDCWHIQIIDNVGQINQSLYIINIVWGESDNLPESVLATVVMKTFTWPTFSFESFKDILVEYSCFLWCTKKTTVRLKYRIITVIIEKKGQTREVCLFLRLCLCVRIWKVRLKIRMLGEKKAEMTFMAGSWRMRDDGAFVKRCFSVDLLTSLSAFWFLGEECRKIKKN